MARNDVDAILVANPNAFHAEVTLDAIAAGKHVLVEKPMCVTRRKADEIIAAQKDLKVETNVMKLSQHRTGLFQQFCTRTFSFAMDVRRFIFIYYNHETKCSLYKCAVL
jgi:hypothetical protein